METSALRWIASALSATSRRWAIASALASLAASLLGIATAWTATRGSAASAGGAAALALAALVVRRIAGTQARIEVECDLYRATARALLDADVLEAPHVEPHFAVARGIQVGTSLAADVAPTLAADVVASLVAIVALVVIVPGRFALAGIALFALAFGLATVSRRRVARLHGDVAASREALGEATAAALDGRLELVATANEDRAVDRVVARSRLYAASARRASLGALVLGRGPLVLGASLAAVALFLDARERPDPFVGMVQAAVVCGAVLSPLIGLLSSGLQVVEGRSLLGPFADIVAKGARADVGRRRDRRPIDLPGEVRVRSATFAYTKSARDPVLRDLDLAWRSGPLVLRGPNGSGKSTLLRLLLALRDPDAGAVEVAGEDLRATDPRALRRQAFHLPQRPYLGETFGTVGDAFRMLLPDVPADALRAALARTGLLSVLARGGRDALDVPVGELSAGQRQRLALARMVASRARLILLDEPEANLDTEGLGMLLAIIDELGAGGAMVAIAAHGDELDRLAGATVYRLGGSEATTTAGHSDASEARGSTSTRSGAP